MGVGHPRTRRSSPGKDAGPVYRSPALRVGPLGCLNRLIYLWPRQYDLVHSVDSRPVCILPALMLKKLRQTKLVIDWLDWWGRGGTITERS